MAAVLLAAPLVLAPIGYGLTYIKDKAQQSIKMLPGKVRKVTTVVKTNKIARIFAGIFTFGLSELMKHEDVKVEYFYEDEFIGSDEGDAVETLNKKGNELYIKGNYEQAAILFAKASELAEHGGKSSEKYKENLKKCMQKIEAAERRKQEEAERIKREEAERIRREEAERIRREEAERIRREAAERSRREEALRLERARNESKCLHEEAVCIYQQAEALSSLELKLEKYEAAICRCEKACASAASEEVFGTLCKIFESCLKYDALDEAEGAVQIVRKYFPNAAGLLEDTLANHQNVSWCPDYASRVRRKQEQEEQNRTIMIMLD